MPYKSKAQQRYFHYLESKGKMPKKTVHEFDEATDFNDIPDKIQGYAHGGMIEDEEDNFDYQMGHDHEFDSAGEPHTEDKFEDEQPMEFMARGGRVKRMARGGMVPHPSFVKAIRKSM